MVENRMSMPVIETLVTCYKCHSTGQIYKDKWELAVLLWDLHKRQRYNFRQLMQVYREWKKSHGFVCCDECSGSGSYYKFE